MEASNGHAARIVNLEVLVENSRKAHDRLSDVVSKTREEHAASQQRIHTAEADIVEIRTDIKAGFQLQDQRQTATNRRITGLTVACATLALTFAGLAVSIAQNA